MLQNTAQAIIPFLFFRRKLSLQPPLAAGLEFFCLPFQCLLFPFPWPLQYKMNTWQFLKSFSFFGDAARSSHVLHITQLGKAGDLQALDSPFSTLTALYSDNSKLTLVSQLEAVTMPPKDPPTDTVRLMFCRAEFKELFIKFLKMMTTSFHRESIS